MSEAGAPDGQGDEPREISVLYVEDNQQTGPLVREWLERHDDRFEVTLAVTLEEAADRLVDASFDAVVADYRFPGGSGLDLVAEAREQNPDIPFLLYSARVTDEVAEEAEDAGVTAVIEKGGADQLSKLANYVVVGLKDRPETPPEPGEADDDRLEAFADELVHDLRGPLSVALGHLDLLDGDEERVAQLREALEDLEATIDEMPERAAAFEAGADDR